MKTLFVKALLLGGLLAPASYAFSVYDTAPPIGLPESHAVKYSLSATLNYDDNISSSSQDKEDGMYVTAHARAMYADYESVHHLSYSASIGGRIYDKEAEGTDKSEFLDCNLTASLSHSFSASSSYSMNLNLGFSVDPDVADGVSSALNQGEALHWSWSHSYSQGIDARWSWSANASYSGNVYTESQYKSDDRQYVSFGGSLSYRYTMRTSFSFNASGQHDFRSEGEDSDNIYLNGTLSHTLSPVSSASLTAGVQYKYIEDIGDFYPTVSANYSRRLTSGLSANIYLSYKNENVNNYRFGGTYRSTQTIRFGANFDYAFTHKVSFTFGGLLYNSEYSEHGRRGVRDRSESTWDVTAGMNYKFSQHLMGRLSYRYHKANKEAGGYDRNTITTGLTYSF